MYVLFSVTLYVSVFRFPLWGVYVLFNVVLYVSICRFPLGDMHVLFSVALYVSDCRFPCMCKHQMSYLYCFPPLFFKTEGLSLNLKLMDSARLTSQCNSGVHLSLLLLHWELQAYTTMLGSYLHAGDLNWGLLACMSCI